MPIIPDQDEIKDHAKQSAALDQEACGVIIGDEYHPCINHAKSPEFEFLIDPQLWEEIKDDVTMVIHSHYGDTQPGILTPEDIEQSRMLGVPYALYHADFDCWDYWSPSHWHPWPLRVSGPPKLEDYLGWQFVYGRADCWSLARGWYAGMCNTVLPDYPRGESEELEDPGFDPFTKAYQQFGFELVTDGSIKDNDLLIIKLPGLGLNHAPTHCAVVTDAANGMAIHHLGEGLLSQTMAVDRWMSRLKMTLRLT